MPMSAEEIEGIIRKALPDARIEIQDLAGDGDHYACEVRSEAFRGFLWSNSISWFMTLLENVWELTFMPCL